MEFRQGDRVRIARKTDDSDYSIGVTGTYDDITDSSIPWVLLDGIGRVVVHAEELEPLNSPPTEVVDITLRHGEFTLQAHIPKRNAAQVVRAFSEALIDE